MRIFKKAKKQQNFGIGSKNDGEKGSKNDGEKGGCGEELCGRIARVCESLAARGVFVRRQSNLVTAEISPIGIGGTCAAAFYPDTLASLTELVSALKKAKIPYAVLGSAANVLIPDGSETGEAGGEKGSEKGGGNYVLRGAIVFTKYLRSLAIDGESVFAFCGVTGAELLYRVREADLAGAEFLEGIPCTAGGAAYMNAGAGGRHMSDVVESVLAYGDGDMRVYTAKECGYAYKKSAFMDSGEIILGVTLRLKKSSSAAVEAGAARAREARAHLPKGKSLGCVFKNPPPLVADERRISAGALIEQAGMKGRKIGGAAVSETHANFIINEGGATYENVRSLIEEVRRAVYETHGVRLEEEIRYLNDLWR